MKKTKLYKDNKLIGEFMGFQMDMEDYPYKMKIPHFLVNTDGSWTPNPMVCSRDYSEWADGYRGSDSGIDKGIGGYNLDINGLEFSTRWDSLMLVVDKIERLGYNTKIESFEDTRVTIQNGKYLTLVQVDAETKIKAVYLACVEFVKFYTKF